MDRSMMPERHWPLCGESTLDECALRILSRALRDLDGIYAYVAKTLLAPGTAATMIDEIEAAMLSLEQSPTGGPSGKPARMTIAAIVSCSSRTTQSSTALTRLENRSSSSLRDTRPLNGRASRDSHVKQRGVGPSAWCPPYHEPIHQCLRIPPTPRSSPGLLS